MADGARWRDRARARWGARGRPDPLGEGLWRRTYTDCATAARRASELGDRLPLAYELARVGQQQWPSDSLDVPGQPGGRAHYALLREVEREFREVVYRRRLARVTEDPAAQDRLGDEALRRLDDLLKDR